MNAEQLLTGDARLQLETLVDNCLMINARLTARAITRYYEGRLRMHGVTAAQLTILVSVLLHQPIRRADLAWVTACKPSTLTRNLSRCIRRGWISETLDVKQKTARYLTITPSGAERLSATSAAWQLAQAETLSVVGGNAIGALRTISQSLRADMATRGVRA